MLHSLIPALIRIFGCVPMVKHFNVSYNSTGIGSGLLLCTLRASVARPLLIRLQAEVVTAFNAATSNFLVVGTSTTATELLGTVDITEGTPGFYPTGSATGLKRITANTAIYVKFSGVLAVGTLTSDNTNVADAATVTIGNTTYTFKTALTPTAGEVLIGADADASLLNLIRAINHSGTAGTDYANLGVTSVANTQVTAATSVTSHAFVVTAIVGGTVGNAIATTETSTHLAWGSAVLAGGTDATTGNANIILTAIPLFQGT